MTRWWTWPVLLLIYAAISYAFTLSGARGDTEPGPRKIIGSIVQSNETDPQKRVVEQFKYPGTFPDEASCQKLRASKEFELAVADLKQQIGIKDDQDGLLIETACAPLSEAPVHP